MHRDTINFRLLRAATVVFFCMLVFVNGVRAEKRITPPLFPVTLKDAAGRQVTIARQPKRIISLAPGVTEMVFAIGAGKFVVADTTFCDYPPAAAKLPKIGGFTDPNLEKIVAMRPELVIAERGTRKDLIDRLIAFKLPVLIINPTTVDGVPAAMSLLGMATGCRDGAARQIAQYRQRKARIVQRLALQNTRRQPRVMFLFSLQGSLFSAGPGSHIDEMIHICGGKNIAAATRTPWPQLSLESVVAADPEVILITTTHGGGSALTPASALTYFRNNPHWRNLSAVKQRRIYILDDDFVTIPGPRLINGLEEMAIAIHPELFSGKARP